MEFANCGELFTHIVKKKRLEEEEAAYYYAQLIYGLETIHKNNIVHRDIKPENLLLKENGILTIIDFGLSNQYKNGQLLNTSCGSPCYAAPEMIKGKPYSGLQVDLWSSGIVLYAMVCGYLPFEDKNNEKVYKKILNGHFELPEHLSQDCKDLISKILVVNPKKRYTLQQIKMHPFLKEAFNNYHIDEYADKGKYCEPVIEKMIQMPGFNFKREDILFNLNHNKHNNITATYELLLKKYKLNKSFFTHAHLLSSNMTETTTQSLNTTQSPIRNATEEKMVVTVKKNSKAKINEKPTMNITTNPSTEVMKKNSSSSSNKRGFSVSVAKTSREMKYSRHYTNTFNSNSSYNKTIDINHSKKKNHYKGAGNKNDISVSLDVSKIISKNKIDSNIIIGVPKLVPINKKIFASLNSKHNKFYYKAAALNNDYKLNYSKYSNKFSNCNKNVTVNTSVTYESSPSRSYNDSNQKKSKNKKMVYIPSNTINLIDDSNQSKEHKRKSVVHHYSSYTNKSPSMFREQIYKRSQSLQSNTSTQSDKKSQSSLNYVTMGSRSHSNSAKKCVKKYSMLEGTKNHNISSSSISYSNSKKNQMNIAFNDDKKSEKDANSLNDEIPLFKTTTTNLSTLKNPNKKNKNIHNSSKKYNSIRTKFKTIKSNNKAKCNSPIPKKASNNKSNYCPSFTESTSPAGLDKILISNPSKLSNGSSNSNTITSFNSVMNSMSKNIKLMNKKQNDISISIKNENIKHSKKESYIRPSSPKGKGKKNIPPKNKKNIKSTKPTVIDIDITDTSSSKSRLSKNEITNINTNATNRKNSASNSQKNLTVKTTLRTKAVSKDKSKKVHHTHDIGIVDLSHDDVVVKPHKKESTTSMPSSNTTSSNLPRISPPEIHFDLEDDAETKNKIITSSKDFALCTTTSSQEEIYNKLLDLCKENTYTLTEIDKMKYICKKDSDNTINIEVSTVGKNNVLKLYHLNGQESITKEMIKKIIINIGF